MEQSVCTDGSLAAEEFDPSCFHIVALGASAGGLESLEKFFNAMPDDSGMAFVVLQHLSPDFRSLMDELLARHTNMPIHRAEDDMAVEPNTIYLNPPRKNMIIAGGKLCLSDADPEEGLSLPIDQFFRSLAQDLRRQAIAIVLSGTGSDGSRGIRDVFEAGGLVISETEETAKFDGMPHCAHETGCVHLVLAPDEMPEALISYVNQALSPQDFAEKVFVPPRLGGMEAVFRLLRDEYGIDFSHYKPNTVVRRIERRIALQHSESLDAYLQQLQQNHEELDFLYRDLLIGVTRFFRDSDAFEILANEVILEIIASKEDGDELRIWVAGTATGEEAYSLAILFDEAIRAANAKLEIKVFATDVHPASLEIASVGEYPKEALEQIEPSRLEKYFIETAEGYKVQPRLRQMIVFAQHNVFRDAPFTKLDFISCRNLLIYLQPLAQKKAISLFHFGLRTRGVLMLGPSESVGDLKDEFESCNNRWKIFRKSRDVRLPSETRLRLSSGLETRTVRSEPPPPNPPVAPQRSLLMAYDKLLEHFVSAAFLIDSDRNVLHIFGSATEYMQPRAGRLSIDVLELVHRDLKPSLASAIQRVRRGVEPHVKTAVHLKNSEGTTEVGIDVFSISDGPSQQQWFVIALDKRKLPERQGSRGVVESGSKISEGRINDLEVELRYTKESLQTTVEELETSNEELQATNEELVASNEELQSTNEELHSVNEELYTVNAEYQNKIGELTELTADMENLLESTEIGTVFLDEELKIRKYTGKVEKWFDLVKRDIGRRISAFSNSLNYGGLLEDIEAVRQHGKPREREIQDHSGKWLHLRLHPYRRDGDAGGVVMTLIDISSLKQTKAKAERLSAIVESSDDAIIGKNFGGRIESWNAAAETMFGYSAAEAIGQDISLILPDDVADEARQYFEQIRRGESIPPIEVRRRTKGKKLIDIAVRFSPIRDLHGEVTGMSAICRDITEKKKTAKELNKLALVARHTDNAVVITDKHGLIEWVNEGFTHITGYKLEEVIGQKPGSVLQGPESDPATIELMRERLRNGEGFDVEIINYDKRGNPYWIAIEVQPLKNASGRLTGFMAIQRNITPLKEAQARAEEEVALRDRFLAMLSHELRNPLSAIKNGLAILDKQTEMTADERDEVETVLRSQVEHVTRLLDDLLDVSRIKQDKVLLKKEYLDLRTAAKEAAAAVRPLAEERGCPVTLQLPEEAVTVFGDSARLQQVQTNLLTNAIRHSERGDPITLTIECHSSTATIRVSDVGEGISPEQQEKVFDLFYQTDTDLSQSAGGLGVGLSLVRDFVAKHDGQVSVASDGTGKGTTFEVTLPLADERIGKQKTATETDGTPSKASNSMRIVIVEDQPSNRIMLRKLLELEGHRVWEAANGQEGIELIQEECPDVALVDIGLPDMSGYEVAERLYRLDAAHKPLLAALTGFGQETDKEKALQAGFDAHLTKPFDQGRLAEVLSTAGPNRAS